MRFQVVSSDGSGLGIASHLSSEGHAVTLTLISGDHQLGSGVVDKGDPAASADILVFDSDEYGERADFIRESGKRVLGASLWSKTLDENSEYVSSMIRALGWNTDKVTKGTHLYVTGWFNGDKYISTYASILYRRFMSSGRGPDVKFTGVLSNFWLSREGLINERILKPLSTVLRKANHRGPFHIHLLVQGDEFSVLEMNASLNHPLSLLLFENSKLTISNLLLNLLDESSKPIIPLEQWASSVMLTLPPYPYPLDSASVELKGISPGNLKHLWLVDVMKKDDKWFSAGMHGKIGYVTARGSNIVENTRRMYRTLSNLDIPGLQYRDDIGRNTYKILATLKESGWLR